MHPHGGVRVVSQTKSRKYPPEIYYGSFAYEQAHAGHGADDGARGADGGRRHRGQLGCAGVQAQRVGVHAHGLLVPGMLSVGVHEHAPWSRACSVWH